MAVNTHRRVSNDICSQGMVVCVLGVFLGNSETARKLVFEDGNQALMIKAVFSTWGSWIITACQKSTLDHFSLYYNSCGLVFAFSEKKTGCLSYLAESHMTYHFT